MLMRTTARRTAAVLMVALVAMLLVASGGSARAAQHRASAASNHVSATSPAGRQTYVTTPSHHEQPALHLDLHATVPPALSGPSDAGTYAVDVVAEDTAGTDNVVPHGRAPPAL